MGGEDAIGIVRHVIFPPPYDDAGATSLLWKCGITSCANNFIERSASGWLIMPKFTWSEADVVRCADPCRAFGNLGFEVLLGDEFDHLLVVRVILGSDARHPFRRRIDDGFEINVQRLTRDRRRLIAASRAEHVESQHHAAAAFVAGRAPSLTIDFDQLGHLRAGKRDAHEMMPEAAGVLE